MLPPPRRDGEGLGILIARVCRPSIRSTSTMSNAIVFVPGARNATRPTASSSPQSLTTTSGTTTERRSAPRHPGHRPKTGSDTRPTVRGNEDSVNGRKVARRGDDFRDRCRVSE